MFEVILVAVIPLIRIGEMLRAYSDGMAQCSDMEKSWLSAPDIEGLGQGPSPEKLSILHWGYGVRVLYIEFSIVMGNGYIDHCFHGYNT